MFRKLGMFDKSLGMFQPPGSIPYPGPQALFANGEQGAWYDPSDFSTMFQDSAGTTPVTAIEQPVGRILDKSGRGNTATQSTTTSRPILRNLYNMLTYTEDFSNAAWIKTGASITTDATVAPDGASTADLMYATAALAYSRQTYISTATSYSFSYYAKAQNKSVTWCYHYSTATYGAHYASLIDGSTQSSGGSGVSISTTSVGSGWWRITLTVNSAFAGSAAWGIGVCDAKGSQNVTPNGTDGIYVWGASLVPTNEASIPYQRVVTNTLGSGVYNTDLTKFKPYLYFDGTDDWLVTGNIDFSATDKMSVFAGVRKLKDTGTSTIVEFSGSISSNNGSFRLVAPINGTTINTYNYTSRGTSISSNTSAADYPAPITNVSVGLSSISDDSNNVRINGINTSISTDQGDGNYSTYPLYVGSRAGTTSLLNGRIYSLIIRGALTTPLQLRQTETWVANKTGVTL